eukprot:TRINITY_DN26955_c1_g1_i3.p1 TRINITY_DN26955_c1_g1~~TRINITY_DN26955_c1_g1_i3.p1  ORF type:complete len:483 (-),score=56.05 TRINITY_DN26955_c1_g1_i3:342-1790(-)
MSTAKTPKLLLFIQAPTTHKRKRSSSLSSNSTYTNPSSLLFRFSIFLSMQRNTCSSGREMQGMSASLSPSQIPPLQHQHQHNQMQSSQIQLQQQNQNQSLHFDQPSSHDDLFDQIQMLSNLSSSSSWSDLSSNPKSSPFLSLLSQSSAKLRHLSDDSLHLPYDDSALLAARLRHHQITAGTDIASPTQLLLSRAGAGTGIPRSPSTAGDTGLLPLPLTLGSNESSDSAGEGPVQGLFSNGFGGSLSRNAQTANQQQFHRPQTGSIPSQNFGAPAAGMNQPPAPARQRVRARRGQATDPHSIAERLRRERIAERMKALQELVPNANKTDKASMLDEIIDYVKFLQLQVKVLSMSRLGGAAAVAPLVADISSEASGGMGRSINGAQTASFNDSLAVTEHQVAKMMEDDMGSAMQYLQGKGLCLMPISLATAISSHPRAHNPSLGPTHTADVPSSPSMSVLTAQSAMGNGGGETSIKEAASVSKP